MVERKIKGKAIALHRKHKGKISVQGKVAMNKETLELFYTPGVASASEAIASGRLALEELTWSGNSVAIITDGSAVLGLGNIGPKASLPVMEGKAVLFKELAGIDAVPIAINAKKYQEIVQFVKAVSPSFGAINLEDIAAPKCFEVCDSLHEQGFGTPFFHDDQHGTAIVVAAALMNALKVVGKWLGDCRVVVYGAGAAGLTVARALLGLEFPEEFGRVRELHIADQYGLLYRGRPDMNKWQRSLVSRTELSLKGSPKKAFRNADIFIGLSAGNIVGEREIEKMGENAIVFALANPVPEIAPEKARSAGARVVATGRSDFPNQVNNALAFPGMFRGVLDSKAKKITREMMFAAAKEIAASVKKPSATKIISSLLNKRMHRAVARAVKREAKKSELFQ